MNGGDFVNKKKLIVFCASNDRYIEYSKQVISSAYNFGNWDGDFCVISNAFLHKEEFNNRGIFFLDLSKFDISRLLKVNKLHKRWNDSSLFIYLFSFFIRFFF